MRQKIIMGNWKMHGSLAMCQQWVEAFLPEFSGGADCVIFPPAVYAPVLSSLLQDSGVVVGLQDISVHASGAYTGEISAEMALDCGAKYTLVGHSERRQYHQESDEVVVDKAAYAISVGLLPVICIGETLAEREAEQTQAVVARQLQACLDKLTPEQLVQCVIAYEPVWAIGTGLTATPEQAQAVHAGIRAHIAAWSESTAAQTRIVYGGSVKPNNATTLFAQPDIDGGLVGGASLKPEDFLPIIKS